jgi:serine/threonine protein kinase/DNA-binding response OmpR family regulator
MNDAERLTCPYPDLLPTWPRVGPWRALRTLGKGGMGAVFVAVPTDSRATDLRADSGETAAPGAVPTGAGKEVALKIIDPRHYGAGNLRLLAEVRAAASVRHPNLVPCIDVGEACELSYLVMDLVTGRDAHDLLDHGRLAETDILAIAADMAAALGALHAAKVMHRDVKPSNMLRHADGRWMLADFGLARIDDGAPRATVIGHIVGTPDYMAPEQLDSNRADGRADLYSLGASLFQLATGRTPHPGKSPWAIISASLTNPFPDARALRPDLSAHVAAIIAKLGAKRPEDRYADARAVADDVALVQAGRAPVHALAPASEAPWAKAAAAPTVLLIDDDPMVRRLFGSVLHRRGWHVEVAEDGRRGITAARNCAVAVIDLLLPDIAGIEVVRTIHTELPHLPLVVLTHSSDLRQLDACREAGAFAVLDKIATTPTVLADTLAALVAAPPKSPPLTDDSRQRIQAATDGAIARLQVQVQRADLLVGRDEAWTEIAATAHGIALAAQEIARPAAAQLAGAIAELARQVHASRAHRVESTRVTLQRGAAALRPLLLGAERQLFTARILVVDDEPAALMLARHALQRIGFDATEVASAAAAMEHLRRHPCDLLMTDVLMEGGSGFHLADQARRLPGHEKLPVIFVTALREFAQFFDARHEVGADLQTKPFLLSELGTKALILLAQRFAR